ncbi:AAA family ATPase [candidate division WWE3 bacterium]|nr:AAA family ATPase [candidate division WWE3 bacterium]
MPDKPAPNKAPSKEVQNYVFDELTSLSDKVDSVEGMPEDLQERIHQMLNRLDRMARMGHYASEFDTLSRYIEVVTSIPWVARTEDNLDIERARQMLDSQHYGMPNVKERILEYLATMNLIKRRGENAIAKSPVLLLVGLQGVGKTTLAKSVADTLGREFIRVAMGAIGSSFELRGKSKALPGAEPGQIIKALMRTKVRNPLILLDEIEKASGDKSLLSDVMAILLEILDPNQNIAFRDHYVDYPVDLSQVLFICSANNTGTLSAALLDRMEIVKMPSYTNEEKAVIARDYLFPKIREDSGLKEEELQIDPSLWPEIVNPFGYDSGIRSLGRILQSLCRKVAMKIVTGEAESVYITQENLKYFMPSW